MSRALFILMIVGAIAGVMVLFMFFVGRELFYDWRRGRRLRKIAGDAELADQAVQDFDLQCELDDALLTRGLAGHKRLHPAQFKKAMRPTLKLVP